MSFRKMKRMLPKKGFKKRFRKKKPSDFSLVHRQLKTYPMIITAQSDVPTSGNAGTPQAFSVFINYPGYWCNAAGTIGLAAVYSGNLGYMLRNATAATVFDEYKVIKVVSTYYPEVTQYDENNAPNNTAPVYTASWIDTDSIYTTNPPVINQLMNYSSFKTYPATLKSIRRSVNNTKNGVLERGWYNCQYANPSNQPVAVNTISPVAKRSSIGFMMPTQNVLAGAFIGRILTQWYVRFRGTSGSLNTAP